MPPLHAPPPFRNRLVARHGLQQVLLDVLPVVRRETAADVPAPTVLWVHDGGFRSGSKDIVPIAWLTRCGFNVASLAYRLLPDATYPDPIVDVVDALAHLREHAEALGISPDAFALVGYSCGSYLAMMAALAGRSFRGDAPTVRCVVNGCGLTDLLALADRYDRRDRSALNTPESRLLGRHPADDPLLGEAASPIEHVKWWVPRAHGEAGTHPEPPPLIRFLHLHGERDEVVPLEQSRRMHNRLRSCGFSSKLVVLKGTGHRCRDLMGNEAVQTRVLQTLRRAFEPAGT